MKYSISFLLFFALTKNTFANTISVQINESYTETVKVSGTFLLGIQISSQDELEKLNILFPTDSKGKLCVDISSIDGHYKAYIEHELSSNISGVVELNFPSKYQEKLTKYKSNELAINSRLASSCNDSAFTSLLSSWSNDFTKKNIIILIRSDARKDVAYLNNSNNSVKCQKFKNEYTVTYDKYCELNDIDIKSIQNIIIKRKNLREIPDEIIELAYP